MKNYKSIFVVFFVFLTCILFIVNIIKERKIIQENNIKEIEEKNIIEYKANETIRVRMHKTGEIVAMDMNDYLRGVLPAEMSPKYDIEALKAQAIVARTYTYKKMSECGEGQDADICDNFAHCQAYYSKEEIYRIWEQKGYTKNEIIEFWDKINKAVTTTQGKVITYNGEIINAFFHASSPKKTEDVSQIWGKKSCPYLISVESIEDESYENRFSSVVISFDELEEKINSDDTICGVLNKEDINSICINEYTITGRVMNIRVNDMIISAEKLRTLFGLKSTDFTIEVKDESIIFSVIGYGHGVGMSQVGADTYARSGMNYEQIIKHYYCGVEINNIQ